MPPPAVAYRLPRVAKCVGSTRDSVKNPELPGWKLRPQVAGDTVNGDKRKMFGFACAVKMPKIIFFESG